MLSSASQTTGYPFRGRGLAARVLPFAVVAVLAEASLALPPGSTSEPAAIISVVLLAVTAAAFALPWARLPGWAPVWFRCATWGRCWPDDSGGYHLRRGHRRPDAGGVDALFHERWESACVLAATLASVLVFSLVPVAVGGGGCGGWSSRERSGCYLDRHPGPAEPIERRRPKANGLQGRLHEISRLETAVAPPVIFRTGSSR